VVVAFKAPIGRPFMSIAVNLRLSYNVIHLKEVVFSYQSSGAATVKQAILAVVVVVALRL